MRKEVDSTYSWLVCACSFFIDFLAVGSSYLLCGTLAQYWKIQLCSFDNRNCTDSEISIVQSLIVFSMMMVGAPISKFLIPKIGYRKTLYVGGVLMALGAFLGSISPTIYWLYLTIGVLFGLGIGISYLAHLLVVGDYFTENRNIAFAIVSSGNSIAGLLLVKVVDIIIQEYGLQYGLMIISGIILNVLVFATPCVRLTSEDEKIKKIVRNIVEDDNRIGKIIIHDIPRISDCHIKSGFSLNDSQNLTNSGTVRGRPHIIPHKQTITNSYLNVQSGAITESYLSMKSATILQRVTEGEQVALSHADVSQLWMESQLSMRVNSPIPCVEIQQKEVNSSATSIYTKLFKSKKYVLMYLCDTMGFFSYMIILQYLTDKMTHAGLARSSATWCIAILGVANTISKWICGYLCNRKIWKTYSMYAWSHIFAGIVSCMVIFADSKDEETLRYQCFAFSFILGVAIGPFALTPAIQAEIVPFENIAYAMNAITVGEGFALMLGPLVAGKILDMSSHNYNLLFVIGGNCMLISGILPFFIHLPGCKKSKDLL